MSRLRSTDVWFNAPGIVAAYQPVAAPDSLAARQNVGNDLRMAGRHTAQPGVLPTHDPRTGWTFSGTQYLTTGLARGAITWSVLMRFSDITSTTGGGIGSSQGSGVSAIEFFIQPALGGSRYYANGAFAGVSGEALSGVAGLAGLQPYLNGSTDGAAIAERSGSTTAIIQIGRVQQATVRYMAGKTQTIAISSVTLTPAHMAQYSLQMAYCHVNPDWSAWGRRRRYFYAPAQAGFLAAWAAHSNSQIGTGASL